MILVPVGEHDAPDAALVFFEIGDVGNDEVDARHIVGGEGKPRVHHDDVLAVFESGHVLADLSHAAEETDLQAFRIALRLCLLFLAAFDPRRRGGFLRAAALPLPRAPVFLIRRALPLQRRVLFLVLRPTAAARRFPLRRALRLFVFRLFV